MKLTVQVAPDDCTGCGVCVEVCPAHSKEEVKHKAINMTPVDQFLERERERWDFFLELPELDRDRHRPRTRSRAPSCASRCSSSPGPAPAAARPSTSS